MSITGTHEKKEIQKLSKAEYDFDLIHNTDFQRVMDMLDEFTDWALKKDYINSWDKYAIIDLLIPYMKALQFVLPDGIVKDLKLMKTILEI